jgi:hypothetical protein
VSKVDGDLDQEESCHQTDEAFFRPGLQWFPTISHGLNLRYFAYFCRE